MVGFTKIYEELLKVGTAGRKHHLKKFDIFSHWLLGFLVTLLRLENEYLKLEQKGSTTCLPHKEITNNFFITYFMALYAPPLGSEDDIGEVLMVEEPREDLHHVGLVVVPLEAVLLVTRLPTHAAVCLSLANPKHEQSYL